MINFKDILKKILYLFIKIYLNGSIYFLNNCLTLISLLKIISNKNDKIIFLKKNTQ